MSTLSTCLSPSTDQPQGDARIKALFRKLAGLYGSKLADAWVGVPESERVEVWGVALRGFSGAELAAGLSACVSRGTPWPPTAPEFAGLCRAHLDPEVALAEAQRAMSLRLRGEPATWPHPAVFWAAQEVGAHDLMYGAHQRLLTRWRAVLARQIAIGAWKPIPPSPAALITHTPAPPNPEQIARLRAMVARAFRPAPRRGNDATA